MRKIVSVFATAAFALSMAAAADAGTSGNPKMHMMHHMTRHHMMMSSHDKCMHWRMGHSKADKRQADKWCKSRKDHPKGMM